MEFEYLYGVRWISYVVPFRNPYAQAKLLLEEGCIAEQYTFIDGSSAPREAARLHHSLDAHVRRKIASGYNLHNLPEGILTLTSRHLCVRESYLRGVGSGFRLNIFHVSVESDPKAQARQLLQSGIASKLPVVLRAVETSKRNVLLCRSFIDYLDEWVFTNYGRPRNFVCPPPRALILYTTQSLICHSVYLPDDNAKA